MTINQKKMKVKKMKTKMIKVTQRWPKVTSKVAKSMMLKTKKSPSFFINVAYEAKRQSHLHKEKNSPQKRALIALKLAELVADAKPDEYQLSIVIKVTQPCNQLTENQPKKRPHRGTIRHQDTHLRTRHSRRKQNTKTVKVSLKIIKYQNLAEFLANLRKSKKLILRSEKISQKPRC